MNLIKSQGNDSMKQVLFTAMALGLLNSCSTVPEQEVAVAQPIEISTEIDDSLKRPDKNNASRSNDFCSFSCSERSSLMSRHKFITMPRHASNLSVVFSKKIALKEAARQYWLAGEKEEAQRVLVELEDRQDVYARGAESEAFKSLKKLIRE